MSAQPNFQPPADWRNNGRFCKIYPYVLAVEGGLVTAERAKKIGDKGGATNHGIAFNYNQGYLKKYNILFPGQMDQLTKQQAIEIYYRKYWLPSQADELPDTRLAAVYFDHVVNAGQGSADQLLTKLDKALWFYKGDGENISYFWQQCMLFMLHRLWFYANIKQWKTFGLGWFNRLIILTKGLHNIGG